MTQALRRAALATALVITVAGCGGGSSSSGDAGTSPAGASSGGSLAPGTYKNPVYTQNFPDPGVLSTGNGYLAFGTNGPNGNVPTLSSPDLVHWTSGQDALPTLGSWAMTGNTWAPEVIKAGSGYVLFYVARATSTG